MNVRRTIAISAGISLCYAALVVVTRANVAQGSQLPIAFETNVGQTDSSARFLARAGAATLFFTDTGMIVREQASVAHVSFVGSHSVSSIVPGPLLPGRVNYIYGKDPSEWHTEIPTYSSILYRDLYPGITLEYTTSAHGLKSTYLVDPGADPCDICWHYPGATEIKLNNDGALSVTFTSGIELLEDAPIAWHVRPGNTNVDPVDVQYTIHDSGVVGFHVKGHDPTLQLVTDPQLNYSTYFGGDSFITKIQCIDNPCRADIHPLTCGNGTVNVNDLLELLARWGEAAGPADIDFNRLVNVSDLLILIGAWGPCA